MKILYNLRHDNRGFTLIELMVVLVILSLVATAAIPRLSGMINVNQKNMAVLTGIAANPAGLAQVSVYLPNLLLLIGIGVVTWYQQQLSASGNPQMAMMNWFMPLFLTFICVSLPGGVLLYWGVSSVMGVVHQVRVTRQTAREMQEKPVLFKDKPV